MNGEDARPAPGPGPGGPGWMSGEDVRPTPGPGPAGIGAASGIGALGFGAPAAGAPAVGDFASDGSGSVSLVVRGIATPGGAAGTCICPERRWYVCEMSTGESPPL